MSLLVVCFGLLVVAPSLSAQGYFQFQGGGVLTRVGSADGPLAEGNIVSQILAGVDGLSLTPVDVPKPNHLGIITVRNIVEVPFLQTQDTAYVRFAAWDASIWGMNYREVPPYAIGISSLSTVFLHGAGDDNYLNPFFHGTVIVPQTIPEPSTYGLLAFGMGLLIALPRMTSFVRGFSNSRSRRISAAPKSFTCLLLIGLMIGGAVQAHAQIISAKNLGGLPLFDEDGNLLSVKVGRVELWWGTNLLNQPIPGYPLNRLVKDGYFAFGDPKLPGARSYVWTPITVRIWDSSVGETFADAVAVGHGYASVDTYVLPVTGSVPPYALADLFPGLRLLPMLPHLQMTRDKKRFTLEVSGEYGQILHLYGAPTPMGPWTSYYDVIGRGRAVPFRLPLDSDYFDFINRGPANSYFKVVSD